MTDVNGEDGEGEREVYLIPDAALLDWVTAVLVRVTEPVGTGRCRWLCGLMMYCTDPAPR